MIIGLCLCAAVWQTVGGPGKPKLCICGSFCDVAEEVYNHGDGLHFSFATLQSIHSLIFWL
jgi:hypothetical protein